MCFSADPAISALHCCLLVPLSHSWKEIVLSHIKSAWAWRQIYCAFQRHPKLPFPPTALRRRECTCFPLPVVTATCVPLAPSALRMSVKLPVMLILSSHTDEWLSLEKRYQWKAHSIVVNEALCFSPARSFWGWLQLTSEIGTVILAFLILSFLLLTYFIGSIADLECC